MTRNPLEACWDGLYDPDLPVDESKLADLVYTAIAGHRFPQDRATLLDAVDEGEVNLYEPDEDGWRSVTVGGNRIVHAHWTRFCSDETLEALAGPLLHLNR